MKEVGTRVARKRGAAVRLKFKTNNNRIKNSRGNLDVTEMEVYEINGPLTRLVLNLSA